jgi:hypothetical protein
MRGQNPLYGKRDKLAIARPYQPSFSLPPGVTVGHIPCAAEALGEFLDYWQRSRNAKMIELDWHLESELIPYVDHCIDQVDAQFRNTNDPVESARVAELILERVEDHNYYLWGKDYNQVGISKKEMAIEHALSELAAAAKRIDQS